MCKITVINLKIITEIISVIDFPGGSSPMLSPTSSTMSSTRGAPSIPSAPLSPDDCVNAFFPDSEFGPAGSFHHGTSSSRAGIRQTSSRGSKDNMRLAVLDEFSDALRQNRPLGDIVRTRSQLNLIRTPSWRVSQDGDPAVDRSSQTEVARLKSFPCRRTVHCLQTAHEGRGMRERRAEGLGELRGVSARGWEGREGGTAVTSRWQSQRDWVHIRQSA